MNTLLKNCLIITQNKKQEIISCGSILIKKNKIEKIFKTNKKISEDVSVVDLEGAPVMPGLINAHAHLGEIVYRGYIKEGNTKEYIKETETFFKQRVKNKKNNREAICNFALLELLKNGVTTLCAGRTWPEAENIGLRSFSNYMLMSTDKLNDFYDDFENQFENFYKKIKKSKLTVPGLMIHSLNFIDSKKLIEVKKIMDKYKDLRLFIHIGENKEMEEDTKNRFGLSSIQVLNKYGLLNKNIFLVHSLFFNKNDYQLIKKHKANIVSCPVSNIRLENGCLNVAQVLKDNINLIISTDGPASNNSSNLLNECKTTYLLNKIFFNNTFSAQKLLDLITIFPAKALGMQDKIGSIEEGKCADILVLDKNNTSLYPMNNIVDNLIFALSGDLISSVIVDGKFIYKDKKLISKNQDKIIENFNYVSSI